VSPDYNPVTEQLEGSPAPDGEHGLAAYRAMYRARCFDRMAVALQRQGSISGYGEARGQEAVQIAVARVATATDMIFPSYRQPGAALERGVPIRDLLRFHARESYCPWDWRGLRFAPYTVPVGTQLAHATGWAMAEARRGSDAVVFVFFGDGASSQGEVHEAMNFAGLYESPIVFVCENNGWAISLPFAKQTRAPSLHIRARGYGFAGEHVDGNDYCAVFGTLEAAAAKARSRGGPTLVEAVTFRMGGHTTSDDPSLYRTEAELAAWAEHDPLSRELERLSSVPVEAIRAVEAEVDDEMDAAARAFIAERMPPEADR